jgi:hypothetical protein
MLIAMGSVRGPLRSVVKIPPGPITWPALDVGDGRDPDDLIQVEIKEAVRKTVEGTSAEAGLQIDRPLFRRTSDQEDGSFHFVQERETETTSPRFIKGNAHCEFGLCLGVEDQWFH